MRRWCFLGCFIVKGLARACLFQVPRAGPNSYLQRAWLPPDPPPGHGEHRYVFQVFALMPGPSFPSPPGRREFIEVILNRAVAVGCLIGTYERADRVGVADEERAIAGDAPLSSLSPQ